MAPNTHSKKLARTIGSGKSNTFGRILRNYELYLFLLPAILIIFIFSYIPM